MRHPISRRHFFHHAGCAACATAASPFLAHVAPAAAQAAYERLDARERLRLADLAMDLAQRAGASYADLRITRYRWQELTARDGRLDHIQSGSNVGFDVRFLIDGAWGFAGGPTVDEASLRAAAVNARENARAMKRLGGAPVVLETLPAAQDDWSMPMRIDPFAVPENEKIDLLMAVNAAAKASGADFSAAWVNIVREEKFFASSVGSRLTQSRTRIEPSFNVTATNRQTGRFEQRTSLAPPRGAGWEYVRGLKLDEEAAQAALQARQKLRSPKVEPGRYDLVLDPTNLWLTLHETVGHSTELDRALGWEANYAGTSFVTPDKRGTLRYGSPLMNVIGERAQTGGLSTVGYDDDGVKSSADGFAIIKDGIFQNYQMAIGQAHLIGEKASNGCAYADGPESFPIQRMPNISLQPNPQATSLDDLIGGVDNGIYIVGNGSWSIDQQRRNFQFGGQLFYEIKGGKLGQMLTQVAYQAETQAFWTSLDGLGDRSTYFLGGTMNCGKGEPSQSAPVSHGAVPARFRGVSVFDVSRDDI